MQNMKQKAENEIFSGEPYPLVTLNSRTNKFEVNEETRDFLKKLDAPIGVIAVAGMYRTGKSYLLNRMLLNQSRGFDVGPTINPCTKGVWIWGKPIDGFTPDGEPIKVLVMDTEGLGALDEDSNHDVRIFSLAILLSSYFIYNSMGSIDENALSQLSLVINLTKNIQVKSGGIQEDVDPEELAQYFPSFMWVVRDFTLQLVDSESEPITSKEYLEKALGPQKGFSEMVEQKNRIRRLLKSFFKERDCCTMIRPLTKEDQLQNLAEMDLGALRPEFVEQVHTLRRKVINRIKPKTINGRKLNGEMLYNLALSYAEAINKGAVPSIESSWSYICKNECLKAMQDSYEVFERKFYNTFQESVPMNEQELAQAFKEAKKLGFEIFDKVAVGEAKNDFVRQLKAKMLQKKQMLALENEKTAEQQCLHFLQQNYEAIAQKLRNQEYDRLDSLSHEIVDFLQYFIDEGPKGPKREQIAQDFCYRMLAEGADFFNKNISNELYYQKQFSEQIQLKLKSEILEIKDEKRKSQETLETKLRATEIEKAELSSREQSIRENLLQLTKEKERIELMTEEKMLTLKKDFQRQLDEAQQKMQSSYDEQKEIQRRQVASESEFDKQKALYEQKIEFINNRCKSLEEKEKELTLELKEQKKETVSSGAEIKSKYENSLRELQKKIDELNELVFDSQGKHEDLEQKLQMQEAEMKQMEDQLRKDLLKTKELLTNTQLINKQLESKYDQNISQFSNEAKEESAQKSLRIEELESLLKELAEENDHFKNKCEKDQAIAQQKLEFMQVQLEQEKNQREEVKRNYDRMIKTFQAGQRESVIGKEEASKQIDAIKEKFQNEYQNLQETFEVQIHERDKEITQLTLNNQKLELELQLSSSDFKKELEILKENLASSEEERDKYKEYAKSADSQKVKVMEEVNKKFQTQIDSLEKEVEEKDREHDLTIEEIHQQSQEKLQELKNFYESEKQRLELRYNEEKDRAQRRFNLMVAEHETKMREESANHEDDVEMLQSELQILQEEIRQQSNHYENELALKNQQLEALDKYLSETKESLNNMQHIHQQQMEQQQETYSQERAEMMDKIEQLSRKMETKERMITTLENHKESFASTIVQKEKQIETLRTEYQAEKLEIQNKMFELKKKLEKKEDEFNQKKIEFERDAALQKQHIVFTEQKAQDLQAQLDKTVQRYEDRIKIDREEIQRELREKTTRLSEEKEQSEAKYQAKRQAYKELENRLIKDSANNERERAVLMLKYQNLENERENLIKNYEMSIGQLRDENEQLMKIREGDKVAVAAELDRLRRENNELSIQLQDQINNYDKDRSLWEGKFEFLERQKEQSKQDLEDAQMKFQQTVDQLQKVQHDSKSKSDVTHTQMLAQMEMKFNQRMKELTEGYNSQSAEMQQKIKQLEREKAGYAERLELSSRDTMSEVGNLSKKLDKQIELSERLQEELDMVKQERDKKLGEYQSKLEKDRENFNSRKRELELKSSRIESKQTELLLSHERDRAQWEQRQTDLAHQRDDYKSEVERLKAREESYVKEIEKLRYEARNARKTYFKAAQNTETALGASVGASMMGKLNLPGSNRPGAYQPGMYQPKASEMGGESQATDRSSRYTSVKEGVSASMDVGSNKFGAALQSKLQGQFSGLDANQNPLDMSSNSKKFATPSSVKKQDSEESDDSN